MRLRCLKLFAAAVPLVCFAIFANWQYERSRHIGSWVLEDGDPTLLLLGNGAAFVATITMLTALVLLGIDYARWRRNRKETERQPQ